MDSGLMDSVFGEGDDDSFGEKYVIVAVFKNRFEGGVCAAEPMHTYKRGDFVGKLERSDNPFIPVAGVCCNRCVKTITHKSTVV